MLLRLIQLFFLNDGQLDYLGKLANSVILIGLEPKNRLDDLTPWYAQALRPGSPDLVAS